MCGIVGAVSKRNITSVLLDGLKRLEYRGYDSAGMCVMNEKNQFKRLRALGKVRALEELMQKESFSGSMGIAHTRWATHGVPAEHNAHPLMSGDNIAVVHNGIIENYLPIRQQLEKEGYQFSSETDTEVAAHLVDFYRAQISDFLTALLQASQDMEGAFALAVLSARDPEMVGIMRKGCPLVIGIGENENFVASDPSAIMPAANKFIYLEDGDVAVVTPKEILIVDQQGQKANRPIQTLSWNGESISKGHHRHFMIKEILEQAHVIAETLEGRAGHSHVFSEILGSQANELLEKTKVIQIVACGTSYHAGLVAKYWFEKIAKIPCQVEIASEFRYRSPVVLPGTLLVTVSQSGETADTLAALRHAKEQAGYIGFLAICNVPASSLVRESECVLMTRAGMEIGVASTKAFTSQLTAFLLLVLLCAHFNQGDTPELKKALDELKKLPALCEKTLKLNTKIQQMAKHFADKQHALFLGRGIEFPIALEGALKLKEISYIHAEAYPAGELKHGPLALVDKNMPVIVVAPNDGLLHKLKSNIEEVRARGGECFVFTDESTDFDEKEMHVIKLPPVDPIIAPIVYTIPLQLLAYHVAVLKGTDVDQPRNLAKSVTVE